MGNKQSIKNEERSSSDEDNGLSYYQIQAIQRAWRHMSKAGQASCGRQIITKICQKNCGLKRIFQKYVSVDNLSNCQNKPSEWGILKHGQEIVCFLTYIIKNLNNLELVEEKCQEIGRCHKTIKQYGMKDEHWDILGEAISETIRENYIWKKNRQLLKASNILANFVVDRIRTSFVQKEGNTTRLSVKSSMSENKLKDKSIKEYNRVENDELYFKKSIHSPVHKYHSTNKNIIKDESLDSSKNPKRRLLPGIPYSELRKIEQQNCSNNFQTRISSTIIQYNRSTIFNRSRPCICNFTNTDYDMEGNIIKCKGKL